MRRARKKVSTKISKQLMQALIDSTRLKRSTVYAKIAEIARADGRSCSNLVYALEFAQRNGLNPQKFASKDVLEEYKDYRRSHPSNETVIIKTKTVPVKRVSGVKIGPQPEIPEVILPAGKANEARRMAEIYPYIYVLENSVREFIRSTLETVHGANWWNTCASNESKDKASERLDKQGKARYYGVRAPHPIYLVDLDDLRNIIIRNWKQFEPRLPKLPNTQAWIVNTLQIVEEIRNIVAHNNPISKNDELKLQVFYKEWAKRISEEV
jgi:hypothetical protein